MRKGWPPHTLRKVQQKDSDLNELRYLVDDYGIMVAQWMDNHLVLVVSTIHSVGKCLLVNRRRPCITVKNKVHVQQVCKTDMKKQSGVAIAGTAKFLYTVLSLLDMEVISSFKDEMFISHLCATYI
eukprot:9634388-Ditylum_brightwellii.AAC.1